MIDLCCLEYHQYKGNVSGIVKVWKKKTKNEKNLSMTINMVRF